MSSTPSSRCPWGASGSAGYPTDSGPRQPSPGRSCRRARLGSQARDFGSSPFPSQAQARLGHGSDRTASAGAVFATSGHPQAGSRSARRKKRFDLLFHEHNWFRGEYLTHPGPLTLRRRAKTKQRCFPHRDSTLATDLVQKVHNYFVGHLSFRRRRREMNLVVWVAESDLPCPHHAQQFIVRIKSVGGMRHQIGNRNSMAGHRDSLAVPCCTHELAEAVFQASNSNCPHGTNMMQS